MEPTLSQLKELWQKVSEGHGGYCPVCERWGKVYSISMTGSLVKALGWLYKEHKATGDDWINVPTSAPRSVMRSYAITSLKHWGFVKQKPQEPIIGKDGKVTKAKTKTSGLWAITPQGREFILNQVTAPKKAFIYADHVRGYSNEMVSAKEVMDKQFDYDAMMSDTFATRNG